MSFLQQFHLVIRYNKGIYNEVVDMLSSYIFSVATILKNNSILYERYVEKYALDSDFQDVYENFRRGNQV